SSQRRSRDQLHEYRAHSQNSPFDRVEYRPLHRFASDPCWNRRGDQGTAHSDEELPRMSVLGIAVDLAECARIQHSVDRFGEKFLRRVVTEVEIEYSMSMKFPARHLAARFAAKEAVSKAFGTGIGKAMSWRNIDIRKKKSGEPFLVFSGPAQ